MRIISKGQDYYDGIQVYGHDPKSVFIREFRELQIKDDACDFPTLSGWRNPMHHLPGLDNIDFYVIGFCGKLIPCAEICHDSQWGSGWHYTYHYDSGEVIDWLKASGKIIRSRKGFAKEKPKHQKEVVQGINEWFGAYENRDSKFFQMFAAPIWVRDMNKDNWAVNTWVNCELKRYHFQKVFDPVTAYQEIDMYLSGVLALQQPELVQIKDIDQRDKKGFDNWSFKTRPKQ